MTSSSLISRRRLLEAGAVVTVTGLAGCADAFGDSACNDNDFVATKAEAVASELPDLIARNRTSKTSVLLTVEVVDSEGNAIHSDTAEIDSCSGQAYENVWERTGEYRITANTENGLEDERDVTVGSLEDSVWVTVTADDSVTVEHIETG